MKLALAVLALAVIAVAGCGRATTTTVAECHQGYHYPNGDESRCVSDTTTSVRADDSVRSAALAYARAYLTGTALDLYALQGPQCLTGAEPSPSNEAAANAEVQQMRDALQLRAGLSAQAIQEKITDVSVRNETTTSAEAKVNYALPASVTGNDDWVTYERLNGAWKVQDCHPPFGTSSSKVSISPGTP